MNTNTDPVRALIELRTGVEMDAAHDPMGAAKLEALDAAIAALSQQPAAPSAPAWVEVRWEARRRNRFSGEWSEWMSVSPTTEAEVRAESVSSEWEFRTLYALAQQPAAPSREAVAWLRMKPDGTPDWAEDCIGSDDRFLDHELASDGYYLQPLYAAPQQPAAVGEEIMVNAAHDVFTLPLQPSGLLSGPRFVVHVPGPQQPAAVDDAMVEQRARELLEAECGRPLPLDVPVCAAHSAVVAALIAAQQQGGAA